jgi:opacity protein-like surface antigen
MKKINFRCLALGVCGLWACAVSAGSMGPQETTESHLWSVTGSLGYSWYNAGYSGDSSPDAFAQSAIGDGQTPVGRFAIGRKLFNLYNLPIGLEVGFQTGNMQRARISQTVLNTIGGLHPQLDIKPLLDVLATLDWQPLASRPVFIPVKLGIAYRRLQINDRVTFNDLSQVAFEVQSGLGLWVNDRTEISVTYQGIFNGSTRYIINTDGTGHISNIPRQNGVLLNATYKL